MAYVTRFKPPTDSIERDIIVRDDRIALVTAFAELPDEAFNYFAGMMLSTSHTAGGFQRDSRTAIENLRPIIEKLFT